MALYKFLSPQCENLTFYGSKKSSASTRTYPMKLSSLQQLVLVLVRLRAGLLVQVLAYWFDISTSYISKIFSTWIQFMYVEFTVHLKPFMFPSKEIVAETAPKSVKRLKNLRAFFDCTEFFCQSPSNFAQQGNLYSSYKSHTTFKVFVACTPNGSISFVSDVNEGAISDRQIFIQSGFAELLQPGDLRWFYHELQSEHCHISRRLLLICQ